MRGCCLSSFIVGCYGLGIVREFIAVYRLNKISFGLKMVIDVDIIP